MRLCTCMTKTPDIKYHKKNCKYRIDMEKFENHSHGLFKLEDHGYDKEKHKQGFIV